MLPSLDRSYWNERWQKGETGWDIGYAAPAITAYADSLIDKNLRILIPGCGNAWEAEYLHKNGFRNVYVVDIAPEAIESFRKRVPDFPSDHVLNTDFFLLPDNEWDLIIEQTFFCALNPALRKSYVQKMFSLLKTGGTLAGLWFNDKLNNDRPPFGGDIKEYRSLLSVQFLEKKVEVCDLSIEPRKGREVWMEWQKP